MLDDGKRRALLSLEAVRTLIAEERYKAFQEIENAERRAIEQLRPVSRAVDAVKYALGGLVALATYAEGKKLRNGLKEVGVTLAEQREIIKYELAPIVKSSPEGSQYRAEVEQFHQVIDSISSAIEQAMTAEAVDLLPICQTIADLTAEAGKCLNLLTHRHEQPFSGSPGDKEVTRYIASQVDDLINYEKLPQDNAGEALFYRLRDMQNRSKLEDAALERLSALGDIGGSVKRLWQREIKELKAARAITKRGK